MVDRACGQDLPVEQRAAAPLAGGIACSGFQCGMTWGAALAAGAEAHRRLGAGARAEALAVAAAQRIASAFQEQNGALDCQELTGVDFTSRRASWRYLLSGGAIRCFRMAARFAPVAKAEIDRAVEGEGDGVPDAPVSCAALAARGLGADDRQATMAAGLAGGLGLQGGGCGALGAVIWMRSMGSGLGFDAAVRGAAPLISRFLDATEGRFACAEIAGRRFRGVADHAAFLREGGCARVLEALAGGADGRPARPG